MGGVGIAHLFGHLADAQGRIGHQLFGALDAYKVKQIIECLPQMLVQQLGQVPLADIAVVGHIQEGQALIVVFSDVRLGLTDQKAVGIFGLRRRFGLLGGGEGVQDACHILQRLVQLLHFRGL